jgi:hypothetical protein
VRGRDAGRRAGASLTRLRSMADAFAVGRQLGAARFISLYHSSLLLRVRGRRPSALQR